MRIRTVKKDYSDLCLNVPINILGVFAGDFDGDALNVLCLKDAELIDAYALYDPRLNMIISKNDGLFDDSFNLIKDQLVCLNQFCRLGKDKAKITFIEKINIIKKQIIINRKNKKKNKTIIISKKKKKKTLLISKKKEKKILTIFRKKSK